MAVPGPLRVGRCRAAVRGHRRLRAHSGFPSTTCLSAARRVAAVRDGRVIVAFGCGGDRDRGKRPLMGIVAAKLADYRHRHLRQPTQRGTRGDRRRDRRGRRRPSVPTAPMQALVDRREAIARALDEARPNDVVVIAGKGHETGQEFADRTIPFDDRIVARELLDGAGGPAGDQHPGRRRRGTHRRPARHAGGDQEVPAARLGPADPRGRPQGPLREAWARRRWAASSSSAARILGYLIGHIGSGGFSPFRDSGLLAMGTIVALGFLGFLDDFIKIRMSRSLGLQSRAKFLGQLVIAIVFAVPRRRGGRDRDRPLVLPLDEDRPRRPSSTCGCSS